MKKIMTTCDVCGAVITTPYEEDGVYLYPYIRGKEIKSRTYTLYFDEDGEKETRLDICRQCASKIFAMAKTRWKEEENKEVEEE